MKSANERLGKGDRMNKSKKEEKGTDKNFQYSVEKWIENRMGEKNQATRELRNETMQLYERGLLSAETVLDVFGFDESQEIKRKEGDSVDAKMIQKHLGVRNYNETDIKQMRIEQARRNVEALGKLTSFENGVKKETIQKSIEKNIKIMDEVEKI